MFIYDAGVTQRVQGTDVQVCARVCGPGLNSGWSNHSRRGGGGELMPQRLAETFTDTLTRHLKAERWQKQVLGPVPRLDIQNPLALNASSGLAGRNAENK